MAIRTVVTRGFGTGAFWNGQADLITVRGYSMNPAVIVQRVVVQPVAGWRQPEPPKVFEDRLEIVFPQWWTGVDDEWIHSEELAFICAMPAVMSADRFTQMEPHRFMMGEALMRLADYQSCTARITGELAIHLHTETTVKRDRRKQLAMLGIDI